MHQHYNIQTLSSLSLFSSQMGFKIQPSPSPNYLYYLSISLSLILFFLLISSSSAKPLPLRRPNLAAHHRYRTTLHVGAPTTTFTAKKLQMETNKKKKKNKATAFSAMLPKGFVPPSGSSPCHNENPEFVAFYCHLSATNP